MSNDFRYPSDRYILVGTVGKAHGLRGEFKIFCFSEQPENVVKYRTLYLVDSSGYITNGLKVLKCRVQGKGVIVQLETIVSRNKTDEVRGLGVLVAKSELPDTAPTEFYYYQFHGKQIITKDGNKIGAVTKIFNNGAQDVLVIAAGKDEILIPVTESTILNETETELIIDVPLGLLDLNM